VYVLTSIAGTPIAELPNIWAICAPDYAAAGAEWSMIADTLLLYPDGSGEERNLARFRYSIPERAIWRDTAFLSPHQSAFEWRMRLRGGRVFIERYNDEGSGLMPVGDDGAITIGGGCAEWRFERVADPPQAVKDSEAT
jgi:hypothetical protein